MIEVDRQGERLALDIQYAFLKLDEDGNTMDHFAPPSSTGEEMRLHIS